MQYRTIVSFHEDAMGEYYAIEMLLEIFKQDLQTEYLDAACC